MLYLWSGWMDICLPYGLVLVSPTPSLHPSPAPDTNSLLRPTNEDDHTDFLQRQSTMHRRTIRGRTSMSILSTKRLATRWKFLELGFKDQYRHAKRELVLAGSDYDNHKVTSREEGNAHVLRLLSGKEIRQRCNLGWALRLSS